MNRDKVCDVLDYVADYLVEHGEEAIQDFMWVDGIISSLLKATKAKMGLLISKNPLLVKDMVGGTEISMGYKAELLKDTIDYQIAALELYEMKGKDKEEE
jgi:hypothetical protein